MFRMRIDGIVKDEREKSFAKNHAVPSPFSCSSYTLLLSLLGFRPAYLLIFVALKRKFSFPDVLLVGETQGHLRAGRRAGAPYPSTVDRFQPHSPRFAFVATLYVSRSWQQCSACTTASPIQSDNRAPKLCTSMGITSYIFRTKRRTTCSTKIQVALIGVDLSRAASHPFI